MRAAAITGPLRSARRPRSRSRGTSSAEQVDGVLEDLAAVAAAPLDVVPPLDLGWEVVLHRPNRRSLKASHLPRPPRSPARQRCLASARAPAGPRSRRRRRAPSGAPASTTRYWLAATAARPVHNVPRTCRRQRRRRPRRDRTTASLPGACPRLPGEAYRDTWGRLDPALHRQRAHRRPPRGACPEGADDAGADAQLRGAELGRRRGGVARVAHDQLSPALRADRGGEAAVWIERQLPGLHGGSREAHLGTDRAAGRLTGLHATVELQGSPGVDGDPAVGVERERAERDDGGEARSDGRRHAHRAAPRARSGPAPCRRRSR